MSRLMLRVVQRTTTRDGDGIKEWWRKCFAAKLKPPTFLFWSWLSTSLQSIEGSPLGDCGSTRTANKGRMKSCSQSDATSYHPFQAWWSNVACVLIAWDPCNSSMLHTCIWINIMGFPNPLISPCNQVPPPRCPVCHMPYKCMSMFVLDRDRC